MISDSNNLENMVLEEIRRVLDEMGGGRSPLPYPDSSGILFILSRPVRDASIDASCFSEIIRRYPCLLLRAHGCNSPPPTSLANIPEIPGNETLQSLNDTRPHLNAIIALYPSLSFMAQLTLGITPDLASNVFLQFLVNGKPILGLRDDTEEASAAPLPFTQDSPSGENSVFSRRIRSSLQTLRRQYVKILEDWGITWLKTDRLFDSLRNIMEKDQGRALNSEAPLKDAKRAVITQDDVLERIKRGDGEWAVPDGAIITALALEAAEKNNFRLK